MMNDVLNFVKNFFTAALLPSRKRRTDQENNERPSKKFRRSSNSQMSLNEDDWHSTSSSGSIRRHNLCTNGGNKSIDNHKLRDYKHRILYPKNQPVITIEDDKEDLIRKQKSPNARVTNMSKNKFLIPTQQYARGELFNINSNSSYEKKSDSIKKRPALRNSFPLNNYNSNSLSKGVTNGISNNDSIPMFNLTKDEKGFKPTMRRTYSTALEQSIRLDEKRKYQEMLNKSIFSPFSSFAEYSTPIGKIMPSCSNSRGRQMVELATGAKPKTIAFVDLTKPRLSTKDTIAKVLENFDNDVVEVKDNDSDVEILPDPPTPEPDIKVERVNSLKTYIDLSETAKDDWINNLVKNHKAEISKQKQKIEEQEEIKRKFSEINKEIRLKKLEYDFNKALQLKEYILPIEKPAEKLPKLTAEQERKVNICFDKRASENEILISKFNLNITRRDIMTLNGLNWLNDEVINFYMNLIIERAKNGKLPKTHAMNTFFYHRISKDGYTSVRRWTKKVDLFSFDLLVIPIHLSMHWCMAIIDFRSKSISYYDSMGTTNDKCLKILYNYIQQEYLDKKGIEYNMHGWEMHNVKKIPQQMNGSDCGMFSCTFAEFITRNAKITFTQEDMPYLRRKMVIEIIEGRLLIS